MSMLNLRNSPFRFCNLTLILIIAVYYNGIITSSVLSIWYKVIGLWNQVLINIKYEESTIISWIPVMFSPLMESLSVCPLIPRAAKVMNPLISIPTKWAMIVSKEFLKKQVRLSHNRLSTEHVYNFNYNTGNYHVEICQIKYALRLI